MNMVKCYSILWVDSEKGLEWKASTLHASAGFGELRGQVSGGHTVLHLGVGNGTVLLAQVKTQLAFVTEMQVTFLTLEENQRQTVSHQLKKHVITQGPWEGEILPSRDGAALPSGRPVWEPTWILASAKGQVSCVQMSLPCFPKCWSCFYPTWDEFPCFSSTSSSLNQKCSSDADSPNF